MSALSSSDSVINSAKALTNALRHPAPAGPVPPFSVEQSDAIFHLFNIFATRSAAPPRVAPAPATVMETHKGPREDPDPAPREDAPQAPRLEPLLEALPEDLTVGPRVPPPTELSIAPPHTPPNVPPPL